MIVILISVLVLYTIVCMICYFIYQGGVTSIAHTLLFLIGSVILVMFLKISIKEKILFLVFFLQYYSNNIGIMYNVCKHLHKYSIKNPAINRDSDEELSNAILSSFNPYLNIKINTKLLPSKPTILVCNYIQDRLENLFCVVLPVNTAIIMRDFFKDYYFGPAVKHPIYTPPKNGYKFLEKEIPNYIEKGLYVFGYVNRLSIPERSPSKITRFKKGLFSIAKEHKIPITPICIDNIYMNKLGVIPYQNFHIEVGETHTVNDVYSSILKVRKFYSKTLRKFRTDKFKAL